MNRRKARGGKGDAAKATKASKTQLTATLRPAEAVRVYLEGEYLQMKSSRAVRMPTIKEFSDHLGVSASTVRTVLKELVDEGRLGMTPGRGTYLIPRPETGKKPRNNSLGINLGSAMSEDWSGTIFLGAMSRALKEGMTLTALGSVRQSGFKPEEMREALARVDAMIAFPEGGHAHEIDHLCTEKGIPVVHVNPSGFQATANFVSNDYFSFCYHLALAWAETGRKKIAVLYASAVNESVSSAQTHAAFPLALVSRPDARVVLPGGFASGERKDGETTRECGYEMMEKFLRVHGADSVDAVYGFGDYLAEGAAQALLAAGRKIPQDVSVVGGTGLKPIRLECGHLVTMRQPMREIGKAAAGMAISRIHNKGADVPGRYLMPALGEGGTLRPEERKAYQHLLAKDKELI